MNAGRDRSDDDPGRTIVRPNPGGRLARAPGAAPQGPAAAHPPGMPPAPGDWSEFGLAQLSGTLADRGGSSNPIVARAAMLLSLASRMRETVSVADPARLKEALADAIRRFESEAGAAGVPREQVLAARYLLCTFLDEAAASTPWGSGGTWSSETLLIRFHDEARGGENAFKLLSRLAQQPEANRDLLELFFVCLSLGFEGRYRVLPDGRPQLDSLRDRLYEIVRQHAPKGDGALSDPMTPAGGRAVGLAGTVPLWVFGSFVAVAALSMYGLYSMQLNRASDSTFAAIQALGLPQARARPAVAPTVDATAGRQRLAQVLEPEVRQGLVSIREAGGRSIVSITGDGLFEPGSAEVSAKVLPLLQRIGSALRDGGGRVLVTGHTDSQPIRSVRFPSNWHLSQERARAVAGLLGRELGVDRIQSEGRGDAEPIGPNDTPADRARNRRVEITLFSSR
jgi:type VI secretion system protein ImpK